LLQIGGAAPDLWQELILTSIEQRMADAILEEDIGFQPLWEAEFMDCPDRIFACVSNH
jgi:hypothetical protein